MFAVAPNQRHQATYRQFHGACERVLDAPVGVSAQFYLQRQAAAERNRDLERAPSPPPRRSLFAAIAHKLSAAPSELHSGLRVLSTRDGIVGGVLSGVLTFGATMSSLVGLSGLSAFFGPTALVSAVVTALVAGMVPGLAISVGTGFLVVRVVATASTIYRGVTTFREFSRLIARCSGALGGLGTAAVMVGSSWATALFHGMPIAPAFHASMRHAFWPVVGATVGFELLGHLALWALGDAQTHASATASALNGHLASGWRADHPAHLQAHIDAARHFVSASLRSPWVACSMGVAAGSLVLATGGGVLAASAAMGGIRHGVLPGAILQASWRQHGVQLAIASGCTGILVGLASWALAQWMVPEPTHPAQWPCATAAQPGGTRSQGEMRLDP